MGSKQSSKALKDRAYALVAASRAKLIAAQANVLEQALEPVDWDFDPKTTEELRSLQLEVMHRYLKRELSPQDAGLLMQGVGGGGLIKIILPAPQAPAVDKEAINAEFVNLMPGPLRNAVLAWARDRAKAEITA
jgi:hypothetical protein